MGCGPVGQFAIRSCFMLGAGRVIAIDRVAERLEMARAAGAETLNFDEVDVVEVLHDLTGNHGQDSCMDVVGMEASGHGVLFAIDHAKQMTACRWTGRSFYVTPSWHVKREAQSLYLESTPASLIRYRWERS